MKRNTRNKRRLAVAVCAALCVALSAFGPVFNPASAQQTAGQQPETAAQKSPPAQAFEERVKAYVKMREGIEGKMPKLSKDATPEQIEAHKTSLQAAVRAARAGAKPGSMFTPDAARLIRQIIKGELTGKDKVEVRQTVMEAETKGVPLRVNYPYPDSKELVEMPPTLLLKLPQLPKQIRYRFVGNNMLLVDRENGLIIDIMTNALP